MVGPGKGIDTDKYFVICSNIIGSCMGSTGPCTINPANWSSPTVWTYPVVTIGDMVTAQKALIDHLGIEKLLCVSRGLHRWHAGAGMVRAISRNGRFRHSTGHHHQALRPGHRIQRGGPSGHHGAIPTGITATITTAPNRKPGLAVARMIGHITYLSDESMRLKFGRRLQDKSDFSFNFDADFQVESYLRYQGKKFVERFDANSFLYITKAADYYDLEHAARRRLGRQGLFKDPCQVSGDLVYLRLALSHLSVQGHGQGLEKKRIGCELL